MDEPMTHAEPMWRDAATTRAARQREAKAAVTRWTWASAPTTKIKPGYFESMKKRVGKVLPRKPTKLEGAVEEGFDAQGRLRVVRLYAADGSTQDSFLRYEAGASAASIEELVYKPDQPWAAYWYGKNERGQIAVVESIDRMDAKWVYRTHRRYTFDPRGFYSGFTEECDTGDGNKVPHAFDFECDDTGQIVRSWWVWTSSGKRDAYWKSKTAPAKTTATKATANAKATKPPVTKTKAKPETKTKTNTSKAAPKRKR